MRDLAVIAVLFVLAVVAGVTITPLMSIWYDARQSYNAEMTLPREKPKRRNILTADGERLTVAEDDDEQRLFSTRN